MIKQNKGKDLSKIPASKLIRDGWLASTKLDGNYCQVHKYMNEVTIYSSGNKPIKLVDVENGLKDHPMNFILECEFIGTTDGKLGERTKCGIMTTWRTLTQKGLPAYCGDNKFVVLDIIAISQGAEKPTINIAKPFIDRIKDLEGLHLSKHFYKANHISMSLVEARFKSVDLISEGWEGLMLKHKDHIYQPGKRTNDIIKIKGHRTADLKCIGVLPGEGKYEGMIGSLLLEDKIGREVCVGSGLNDIERSFKDEHYIGKVIEIKYERIADTYLQPVFVRIRNDKTIDDID